MAAYLIVYRQSAVRDQPALEEYSRRNHANSAGWRESFGIKPLVANGHTEALEGAKPQKAA